jgi:hypothetical protein
MQLSDIGFAQKHRLAYIDFSLMFKGSIYRQDLINRFQVGLSAGSRDFKIYKQLAPDNLKYDTKEKRYFQTEHFAALFDHDAVRTLVKLANDISDGFDAVGDVHFPVESPSYLNIPDINIVARLVQATLSNKAVSIIYTSLSSGSNAREIVPHSIVDNGLRWHVRAYDRKSNSFRDFVLTRISKVTLKDIPETNEMGVADKDWQQLVPLQLVPHPKNIKHPTAIELDYAMENSQRIIKVRKAMAGYLLRRWNVDCSLDARLKGSECQLWLKNRDSLKETDNLAIAPGFEKVSDQNEHRLT